MSMDGRGSVKLFKESSAKTMGMSWESFNSHADVLPDFPTFQHVFMKFQGIDSKLKLFAKNGKILLN